MYREFVAAGVQAEADPVETCEQECQAELEAEKQVEYVYKYIERKDSSMGASLFKQQLHKEKEITKMQEARKESSQVEQIEEGEDAKKERTTSATKIKKGDTASEGGSSSASAPEHIRIVKTDSKEGSASEGEEDKEEEDKKTTLVTEVTSVSNPKREETKVSRSVVFRADNLDKQALEHLVQRSLNRLALLQNAAEFKEFLLNLN